MAEGIPVEKPEEGGLTPPPEEKEPTLTSEEVKLKGQVETALAPYEAHFQTASNLLDLDINLIKAECFRESSGREDASRWEGNVGEYSIGLMQILLSTAKSLGFQGTKDQLFDPKTNIFYGAQYLKFWMDKTNNDLALSSSCYNGGYRALNYYKETGKFLNPIHVNAVMKYYRLLKA